MTKFYDLELKDKITCLEEISDVLKEYINEKSYNVTQKLHYNSPIDDFKIVFEPEKIALSGLFTTKKRYATWTLKDSGKWKDSLSITGLDIIRSDSPEVVKPMLIEILQSILKREGDNKVRNLIQKYKKELLKTNPNDIAENKGVNHFKKYINNDFTCKKGTPHQVKGVCNMQFFVNEFGLKEKYEIPKEGTKARVVYLKKNKYNRESLSFYDWPKEFDNHGIEVDYVKMIENNFLKKIKGYLEYIRKLDLLNQPTLF